MKLSVSYLSSKYSFEDTIYQINMSNAEFIHVDIMDGKFVQNSNFDKGQIEYLVNNSKKYLDVHLMVKKPEKYLKYLKSDKIKLVYFHPLIHKNPEMLIYKLRKLNKEVGIVIDSDEDIKRFYYLFKEVDYVLVMSVKAGAGGQSFINNTSAKIRELYLLKKTANYNFKIAVDGGINDKTIKLLQLDFLDYVVSGSYICNSLDIKEAVNELL